MDPPFMGLCVGSVPFPSPCLRCLSLPSHSLVGRFGSWPHFHPSLPLFHVASSLCVTVESLLCQFWGQFLGYLYCCGCYLGVSMGWDELRILLFCHLPPKSQKSYLLEFVLEGYSHKRYTIYFLKLCIVALFLVLIKRKKVKDAHLWTII